MRTLGGPVRLPKVPNSKMMGRPRPKPAMPMPGQGNVAGPGNVPGAMVAGTPSPRPMGMKVGGFVKPSSFANQDDKKDVQFKITKPTKGGGFKSAGDRGAQKGEGRAPKIPSHDGGNRSSRTSKVGMPGAALAPKQVYRTR